MKRPAGIFAALLTVVYLLAEVGFDVHTDHHNGRNYIVLLAGGISCERIHPDHPCCHCRHQGCAGFESCCSDIVERLQISESVTSADDIVPECPCPGSFCRSEVFCAASEPSCAGRYAIPVDTSPPRAALRQLCILRV